MRSFAESKKLAAANFAQARQATALTGGKTVTTTPKEITEKVRLFAERLNGSGVVSVPVVPDECGLYGFCVDGVREKVNRNGGGIVFGWIIWEWPGVMLESEFHSVWRTPAGELLDITPKPDG